MSKIYIYDCDWIHDPKVFNPISMKISSYHRQLGDEVSLIDETWKPHGKYDIIYCVRNNYESKLPSLSILDDKRLISMGDAMSGFPSYREMSLAMAAVRPDYLLFLDSMIGVPHKQRYQYVQLTQGFTILPVIQDFKNSFGGVKTTIIIDKNLWDFDDDSLIKLLTIIKEFKYVVFKEPIRIKRLLKNKQIGELFKSIRYDKQYASYFINDYGNNISSIKEIIDFLSTFEQYNKFKPFKVQSLTKRDPSPLESRQDFFRDLEIMAYAKSKKVRLNMTLPRNCQLEFQEYFNTIKRWSNNDFKISYIEHMMRFATEKSKKTIEEVMNNRLEWISYTSQELMYLIKNYYEIIAPWIFIRWGDDILNINLDIEYIRKEV